MMKRGVAKLLLLVAVLSTGMVGYVWEQVTVVALKRQIDNLSLEKQKLVEENNRLKAQIAYLSRSERIKRIASERLGMASPTTPPIELLIDLKQ